MKDILTGIEETAMRLSMKQSHLRNGAKNLMTEWKRISECDEEILSTTTVADEYEYEYEISYYLCAGESELRGQDPCNQWRGDYNKNKHWTECMEIGKLRKALRHLPAAMREVYEEMVRREAATDELLALLTSWGVLEMQVSP